MVRSNFEPTSDNQLTIERRWAAEKRGIKITPRFDSSNDAARLNEQAMEIEVNETPGVAHF